MIEHFCHLPREYSSIIVPCGIAKNQIIIIVFLHTFTRKRAPWRVAHDHHRPWCAARHDHDHDHDHHSHVVVLLVVVFVSAQNAICPRVLCRRRKRFGRRCLF